MRKTLIAFLCLTCSTLLSSSLARADNTWQPISPEELKMTSEPKAPGASAIFLYRQVDRDDGFKSGEYNYERIKILTEEGRKYADVEIPFIKDVFKIRDIKARTVQPDGTSAEFNGNIYEKTVVKAKGFKSVAKTFTLPDVHVGTIIEYSYTVEMYVWYTYDSQWELSAELFTKKAKFSLKRNPDLSLRVTWPVGLPEGTSAPTKQGDLLVLGTQNIPAFQVEDYMPPVNSLMYRVNFVYSRGPLESDPVKFWQKQGKFWYADFEEFTKKRKAMEEAVRTIVVPSDTPETKLQKIYDRVLQIRNLSFEREKTAQEEKRDKLKFLENVEDVWKRGYGSARAVNWLFVALLRAAGFDSYTVFVAPRSQYVSDQKKLLNPAAFNADIVLVKLPGKDLYLDPAAKFAPFGVLPWFETHVQGLALDKDGGQWVETTGFDSSFAKISRTATFILDEGGTLTGNLTVTLGGMQSMEMRTEARFEDDATRKTILEDLVKESVPAASEVELTNKPDWDNANPALIAEYRVKVAGLMSNAGKRNLLPLGIFGESEKHVFEHATRIHPLYFHYCYLKSDDITISLPSNWEVMSVPPPLSRDAKATLYEIKAQGNKTSLHVTRQLRNELVLLEQNKYGVLRSFFETVRTGDEQQVVLQPVTASATN